MQDEVVTYFFFTILSVTISITKQEINWYDNDESERHLINGQN